MYYGSTLRSFFLFIILCCSLSALDLAAQRPHSVVRVKDALKGENTGDKMMCNSDAGEVEGFSGFMMQSNSFGNDAVRPFNTRPDTIFLCFDDSFQVGLVNGSTDISGDPFPSSLGGVGYAFFKCQPTVSGPTLQDVEDDVCVANDGLPPFDSLSVAVPNNYRDGDYTLTVENNEVAGFTIPALFSMGATPSPIVLTLAPMTFDSAANGRPFYDGDPEGPCVNVSTTQSFEVAFLNPITNGQVDMNPAGCDGVFDIFGGVPELRGGTGYTISIVNEMTGATATVTTPMDEIVHSGIVRYRVPAAGTYRITIEDDKSCGLNGGAGITVTHPDGCAQPIVFNLPIDAVLPGGNQCFPVTVENYVDVTAWQMTTSFDPAVLAFTGVQGFHPNLAADVSANGPVSSGGTLPTEGNVRFIYFDLGNTPVTVPDGETLFEICYDILGDIGDISPLLLTDDPTDFSSTSTPTGTPIVNPGEIAITDKAFLLTLTRVNEVCDGSNDGSITAVASGTAPPFTFDIRRLNEAAFRDAITPENNGNTITFFGLESTEYAVRAVAANGDVVIDTIEIEEGLNLIANVIRVQQPTCFGDRDGIVDVEVGVNGVLITDPIAAGYTFRWADDLTVTAARREGVPAGPYEVTVTAPNGQCVSVGLSSLGEPLRVRVRPDMREEGVVDATCSGVPDGNITVSADGGTGPYDFMWPGMLGTDTDAPGDSSRRDNLLPAVYEVIVTDFTGCADTADFVVDVLKRLSIVPEIMPVSCFGEADGIISVSGTAEFADPVLPYEANLINLETNTVSGFQTVPNDGSLLDFENLAPGDYVVVLRDQDPAGCEVMDTFRLVQPDELIIADDPTIRNETCTFGNDGSITATASGGNVPYEYRWVNDSLDMPLDTITPDSVLTGLSADTNYILIVTDANGCMDSLDFRINAPAGAILGTIDTSFISCPGDADGQLSVSVTAPPGETISSIAWFRLNPDGTRGQPVASSPVTDNPAMTDDNLSTGNYVVVVRTSNACETAQIGTVVSPGEVFLREPPIVNNPQCPGDANGSIFLNPGGGTPNPDGTYNYTWSTDPFGAPTTNLAFLNLVAGEYTVTITDANGCQPPFDTTFLLVDPPAITADFQTTEVSCPDDLTMDGTATVIGGFDDGTSGTFNFTFTITNNTTTGAGQATETGLGRGPVTVRITDGICVASFTDTIGSPEDFEVDVLTTPVSCNGSTDGAAEVMISGGTPGYDYSWSNSTDIDSIIGGLAAGTATVDITDARGCTPGTQTFTITEPDPLTLSIDPGQTTPTVECAGDNNGRISVFISSVNNNELVDMPYNWSGNVAGGDDMLATDLAPGTYSVTVTDIEGCQDSLSYTIGEPEAIIFSVLPIEEPLCFGETTPVRIDTAFGGTSNGIGDFTFSVNNDGFRLPVGQNGAAFAGDVLVTVFDSVGCSAEQIFSVNQPPQILIDLPEEIIIELGDSLTRLNPLISPAGDIYEYLWTPAEFLSADTVRNPLIFPFDSRDYTFRVTNANGCQAFADIFVEVDANRNVYIPNVFSPNRDGRNEDFRIFACQGVRSVNSVQVYDRWGGLLFSQNDFEPNCLDGIQLWDGLGQNGKAVNPGVFVYIIEVEFLDDAKLVYRGDITVLR